MKNGARDALQLLPPVHELMKAPELVRFSELLSPGVVKDCVQQTLAGLREEMKAGVVPQLTDRSAAYSIALTRALSLCAERAEPQIRSAINATGIILHTGLGRAVFPETVVDSVAAELKGYVNLAVDRRSGARVERDEQIERILIELTGAEAATVVNNNAGATLLVLAALCAGREVIVSRGQLIEIGGSFRLPDVMQQSGARLVEVGTTNRTHIHDYANAISPNTAAIMRVHPSNYRIVGFTHQPALAELVALAKKHDLILIDDLGAGALVDMERFGLPHEPTAQESVAAGADVILFSGDKLIGGAQAGIILGRRPLIHRIRKHPLMRALRVDKTCLMILERTLHLFRQPERLAVVHPLYRMLAAPVRELERKASILVEMIRASGAGLNASVIQTTAYVGSGSVPAQAIPSVAVAVSAPARLSPTELATRLRMDPACVFARIENDQVLLDMRTVAEAQLADIAGALGRISAAATAQAAGTR